MSQGLDFISAYTPDITECCYKEVPLFEAPGAMVGHKYKLNYKQEPSQYKNLLKNLEANIESMVCTQDFWKDKVNTTKYIKMVSITSIETKLVQKKPNTIAQVVALGS